VGRLLQERDPLAAHPAPPLLFEVEEATDELLGRLRGIHGQLRELGVDFGDDGRFDFVDGCPGDVEGEEPFAGCGVAGVGVHADDLERQDGVHGEARVRCEASATGRDWHGVAELAGHHHFTGMQGLAATGRQCAAVLEVEAESPLAVDPGALGHFAAEVERKAAVRLPVPEVADAEGEAEDEVAEEGDGQKPALS
jgi:hypothetical protein